MPELAEAIQKHRAYLAEGGRLDKSRRARLKTELLERARDIVLRRLTTGLDHQHTLDHILDDVMSRKTDPAAAARLLVDKNHAKP